MFSLTNSWRRFFSSNRVKMNLFNMAAILCLQTVCYCFILSIDLYITSVYALPDANSSGLYDQNIMNRFFQSGNQSDNETCPQIDNSTSTDGLNPDSDQNVIYQKNVANSLPAIIMAYLLGILMPFISKRFVLILSMVGIAIQMIIALAIIYLKLSVYWWYLGAFVSGLSGGFGIIDFITYLIIVDITTVNNRSLWFVRFYALKTGLSALIMFLITVFVEYHGYTGLFWLGLVLQLMAIGVVWQYFDLSLYNHTNISRRDQLALTFDVFTIFYGNRRATKQKIAVLLTLLAYGSYALARSVSSTFYLALANYPICWSEILINIYRLVTGISLGILSIIGYYLLRRLTKDNDALICAISHVFFLILFVLTAFVKYNWQMFTSIALYSFTIYQGPLTLSILARWLNPSEINIAFIFVIVINQLITSFGDQFFKGVYKKAEIHHRNIILFVAAGFCVIPLILNICLYLVKRRMSEPSPPIIDETTSLLANADENHDSSHSDSQNPDQSQSTNVGSPVPVKLFSVGKLTFSFTIGSSSQAQNQTTPTVETNQNHTTAQSNQTSIDT